MVIPTSPSRTGRPVITTAIERPSSPLARAPQRVRPSDDYYLQPASSMRRGDHRRNYSVGAAEGNRLSAGDRESYRERSGYRNAGYYMNQPSTRPAKERDDRSAAYEYADPREQGYRDTAPRPRPRGDSYNATMRERPISMTEFDGYAPRESRVNRDGGPPVTTRGLDNMGRNGSVRHETRPREGSLSRGDQRDIQKKTAHPLADRYEIAPPYTSSRPQVSLHQVQGDEYQKPRGLHDDRYEHRPDASKHRREEENLAPRPRRLEDEPIESRADDHSHKHSSRRHHRDVEDEPDKNHRHRDERHVDEVRRDKIGRDDEDRGGKAAALGAAALAAGGVVAQSGRHRHHDRDSRDDDVREADGVREKRREKPSSRVPLNPETATSGSPPAEHTASDEERRERRRRRRREREERRNGEAREREHAEILAARQMEAEEAKTALQLLPKDKSLREQGSLPTNAGERVLPIDQPAQFEEPKRPSNRQRSVSYAKDPDSSESSSEEDEPRALQVVPPSKDSKESEQPIRGILRKPRAKFPEDPAPIREGVAPLKDAGKSGIPPTARWTKINRRLVNPEALEMGNERYEERDDFVIVLRVLTQDEIQAYATKTQEIRSSRSTTTAGDSQREVDDEDKDANDYRKRR